MQERLDAPIIGELLGLLAHDLRNPLSALHSNLGFLRSILGEVDADTREAVDDGLVSCDGLAHIIDNLDLLGQALQVGAPAEPALVDLGAIAADVVASAQAMAGSHGVRLVFAPRSTPLAATGVRDLLFRALGNLIRNSIQHSSPGASVRVSLREGTGDARVLVEDAGSSLGGELRTVAFTARGQLASKSVPNGRYSRGLGLYCSALAAAASGARVLAAEPPSGTGNLFELVVPRPA